MVTTSILSVNCYLWMTKTTKLKTIQSICDNFGSKNHSNTQKFTIAPHGFKHISLPQSNLHKKMHHNGAFFSFKSILKTYSIICGVYLNCWGRTAHHFFPSLLPNWRHGYSQYLVVFVAQKWMSHPFLAQ